MKKATKILSVAMMAIMLVSVMSSMAFAITPSDVVPTDPSQTGTVTTVGNQIVGIIRTVGIIISVIVIMVIGIKYMIGSAEEKAEYKKVMIPYLVGAILLFGASVFAQAIFDLVGNIGK